jgi:hypothetical protein
MTRSEVRHALFRMKSGLPRSECQHIYDTVEPMIPGGESWATFSTNWDVLVHHDEIQVVKPEVDYDFIHNTCLEFAMCKKHGVDMDMTSRQNNIIQIVEASMLEGKMTWDTYNKTWGVYVDRDVKRIHTKLFITMVNEVTPEMIAASIKSDGAAMTAVPELPVVELGEFTPMSEEEVRNLNLPAE